MPYFENGWPADEQEFRRYLKVICRTSSELNDVFAAAREVFERYQLEMICARGHYKDANEVRVAKGKTAWSSEKIEERALKKVFKELCQDFLDEYESRSMGQDITKLKIRPTWKILDGSIILDIMVPHEYWSRYWQDIPAAQGLLPPYTFRYFPPKDELFN